MCYFRDNSIEGKHQ